MHQKLLRLCLGYCAFALLWVLFGDLLWSWLAAEGRHAGAVQLAKGLAFVLLTSVLLYLLGRRYLALIEEQMCLLREREINLRNAAVILETSQEGVLIADLEQSILHVNPALCQITGYAESEVLGQTPRLFASGRHERAFYQAMWQALEAHDRWSGEVWNRRKSGEIYPQWQNIRVIRDEQGRLSHYIAVFSDISLLKRSQEELAYLASHDPLLDLPNRLLFVERARQELEFAKGPADQPGGALLLIDLDHFKHINEGLGHNIGDALLKATANRLRRHQHSDVTLARLGGDEFALLCEGYSAGCAADLAQRILDGLSQPLTLEGRELFITASIGIVLYPGDAQTVEQLLRNADSALFSAKDKGRSTYAFYRQELTSQAHRRVELTSALRQALEQHQLRAHYQPIYALAQERIVGFEALVRWQHPEQGLVAPGMFMPVAEESGLVDAVDLWMMQQACQQMQAWLAEGRAIEFVSVNVSSRLFNRSDMTEQVARVLAASGLPAHRLELEITENAVMQDIDSAMALLDRLRDLGVRLAIDDFGTGYSSLQRLKRMKVHTLKIDQGFVRGLPDDAENAAITRAVISLAHNLGLSVVAEGIEEPAQADFLLAHRCDLGQGYGFARPRAAADIDWRIPAVIPAKD